MEQHPLISTARRGDLIRVMIFVEDRHGLQVRNCKMSLWHKNPLPTEEPLPTEQPKKTKSNLTFLMPECSLQTTDVMSLKMKHLKRQNLKLTCSSNNVKLASLKISKKDANTFC